MHLGLCVFTCASVCIYLYICVSVYVCVHVRMCMSVCLCVFVLLCVSVYISVCVCVVWGSMSHSPCVLAGMVCGVSVNICQIKASE